MRDKIKNNERTSALKGIAGFAVILFTGLLGGCTWRIQMPVPKKVRIG